MRIKHKLPLAALALTLFAVGATSIAATTVAGKKAEEIYFEDLSAVADGRRNELGLYLKNLKLDLLSLASRPDTADALKAFQAGWSEIGDGPGEELQYRYIEDNPYEAGEKELMDMAMEGDGYDIAHSTYHGRFREHLTSRGYYDIFLFDTEGNLVYSVLKEPDYATNLVDGDYAASGLSEAFRGAMDAPTSEVASFADFAAYAPSHGMAASFMAAPVFDGLDKIGVVAVEVPLNQVQAILSNTHGLGRTGETVLINQSGALAMDSPKTETDDTLTTKVSAPVIAGALKGEEGKGFISGYRGIETVAVAVPLQFETVGWAVASVVDRAEVRGIAGEIRNNVLAVAVVLTLIAIAASLFFSRGLTRPIGALVEDMKRLAGGDTGIEIANAERNDEIGDMAQSVVVFRDAALENIRLEEEATEGRKLSAEEARRRAEERAHLQEEQETALSALSDSLALLARGDLEHRLPDDLPESFRPMVANYNEAVEQLRQTLAQARAISGTLHEVAESLTESSQKLAGRTEEQAAGLTETAASVQHLADSIRQTAGSSRSAMEMVGQTRREAEGSREVMKNAVAAMEGIDQSSQKISSIIGVINEIAFQTNLLALNAGVEAARAGEAGKGFAVVATEVRELAQRCSTAAGEISQLINDSAGEVRKGVDHVGNTDKALDAIIASVGEVASLFGQIASATEEQDSSLKEVSDAVSSLDRITQENSSMAELNSVEIDRLRDQVATLSGRIRSFKTRDLQPGVEFGAYDRREDAGDMPDAAVA